MKKRLLKKSQADSIQNRTDDYPVEDGGEAKIKYEIYMISHRTRMEFQPHQKYVRKKIECNWKLQH